NFAILDALLRFLGRDAGGVDALHAVGALFHHAAAAHRDVRVAHQLQAGSFKIGEEQEIETPHLVRAVVGAIPRADAAVVHHVVEPLGRVNRGAYRTNRLAGSVLALHAGDGLEIDEWVGGVTLVIGVDADPLHLAAALHLRLADRREIIL